MGRAIMLEYIKIGRLSRETYESIYLKHAEKLDDPDEARKATSDLARSERPAPAASASTAALSPRVYFHIPDDIMRADATRLGRCLAKQSAADGRQIVVPGVERINYNVAKHEVRFFKTDEKIEAELVAAKVKALLRNGEVLVVDLSKRYGGQANIRPRHYELWLTRGGFAVIPECP